MKHPEVMQSLHGAKTVHYLELHHLYHSHLSAVQHRTQICFTGRTYFSSGTCFSSLISL